jgi:hypothetical protein
MGRVSLRRETIFRDWATSSSSSRDLWIAFSSSRVASSLSIRRLIVAVIYWTAAWVAMIRFKRRKVGTLAVILAMKFSAVNGNICSSRGDPPCTLFA